VITAKAKLKTHYDYDAIIPITITDINDVRDFAFKLHTKGKAWKGEVFGWQAEYNLEQPQPPLDSKITFNPADFCVGESGIWFFSLMWEHGSDLPSVEFLDDKSIIKKSTQSLN
jgi:hypothetical protein